MQKKDFEKSRYLEIAGDKMYFDHGQTIELACKKGFKYGGILELITKCDDGEIDEKGNIYCESSFNINFDTYITAINLAIISQIQKYTLSLVKNYPLKKPNIKIKRTKLSFYKYN